VTETIRVAFDGLAANKLRSGLTILGLMIGVGSVIVLISVGTGSSDAVQKQIDALGSNVLMVSSAPTLGGPFARRSGGSTQLTLADVSALENRFEAPDVRSVSPVVNADSVTLTYNGSTYSRPRSSAPCRAIARRATTRSHRARGLPALRTQATAA
jgi:putative ABC transport system permease protein